MIGSMDNYEFYSKLLENDGDYWCIAKETSYGSCARLEKGKNDILFISLPSTIKTGQKREELKFDDVAKIRYMNIDCSIHLSENYAPFQLGQTFYSAYAGFPIKQYVREFLKEALKIQSNDLYDYEKLYQQVIANHDNKQ